MRIWPGCTVEGHRLLHVFAAFAHSLSLADGQRRNPYISTTVRAETQYPHRQRGVVCMRVLTFIVGSSHKVRPQAPAGRYTQRFKPNDVYRVQTHFTTSTPRTSAVNWQAHQRSEFSCASLRVLDTHHSRRFVRGGSLLCTEGVQPGFYALHGERPWQRWRTRAA